MIIYRGSDTLFRKCTYPDSQLGNGGVWISEGSLYINIILTVVFKTSIESFVFLLNLISGNESVRFDNVLSYRIVCRDATDKQIR